MPPHLVKRKSSPNWYLKDGRKVLKSLRTTRKAYAQRLLEDYVRKRLGIRRPPRERVSKMATDYLTECRKFNKLTTVEDKDRTLKFFAAHVGDSSVASVTPAMVLSYLSSRKISAERWNTERQVLANFFRFAGLEPNPCTEVRKQKVVRSKIPKALDSEREGKLLAWLEENDPELCRMAIVAGNTGIRVRELANLTWSDLDLRAGVLRVTAKPDWSPKDYEERAIPLNSTAWYALERQRVGQSAKGYVFARLDGQKYGRGLDVRMVRAYKKAGLGSGGFHALRHTYATRAMESGMDPESLRKILGHSDTKTVMKYLHVSSEHVRRVAERVNFGGTKVGQAAKRRRLK